MNALVISGGGSKGAFAGGLAQSLIETQDRDYDMYIGTSTGGLLSPFIALHEFEKIKNIYINCTQHDVFSNCPFRITKKKKDIKIHHLNVIKNFLNGSKTFGESYNLLDLIYNSFSIEEYDLLKALNKNIIVAVSNLSTHTIEYKSIFDFDYKAFCRWIWVSCNYIPFMTLETINGCDYADGSLGVSVAIEEAIRQGAKKVDVVILEVEQKKISLNPVKNPFWLLSNMFSFTKDILEQQNIRVAMDFAKKKEIELEFFYTPYRLTNNPLVFNKEEMTQWWDMGYELGINT